MFKATTVGYREQVEGTWGEFRTPMGRVSFIQTKARLGTSGVDLERRLTGHLRPVREVLSVEKLDFNQLLQRDLDDHRVVEKLIPYLLERQKVEVGPSFFPPIMAVLLPFGAANAPVDNFPAVDFDGKIKDPELDVDFHEVRFGTAYRVQRLVEPSGAVHRIRLGRLHWNEEHAKLVVIDGQHRAMALLAVDRTVNGTWEQSGGGRYRHFYEARVNDLLKQSDNFKLDTIEVPVTVCWFPDLSGPGKDPHKAARKLFVDVNKEARAPSESRLTLLSDTELLNIFTRSLLNRLRQPSPPLPLYAVEYDNPELDKEAAKSVKWTVLSNLFLLKYAVQRCVFGPEEVVRSMGSSLSVGGRPNQKAADGYMRAQLGTDDLFQETIHDSDRTIDRHDLGNRVFPSTQVQPLVDRFMERWGEAILTVLGGLGPYAAHSRALTILRDTWLTDDAMSRLARDALFEGVGLYWTISDSYQAWESKCAEARATRMMAEPPKTDIVRVWEIIREKIKPFDRLRAKEYLGLKKELPDTEDETNSAQLKNLATFYRTVNTNACQLGAILGFAGVYHRARKPGATSIDVAKALVQAWNAALVSPRTKAESRHLILAPRSVIEKPLNRLPRLDTPFATYFRYFWLQLLSLDEAREELGKHVELASLDEMIEEARAHYAQFLVSEQEKIERGADTDATKEEIADRARKKVLKDLSEVLSHWFALKADDARRVAEVAVTKSKGAKGGKSELPTPVETESLATSPETPAAAEDIETVLQEMPDE
ncbi:ParB N-terminal domain-containing protein [Corallococcus sp. M7]